MIVSKDSDFLGLLDNTDEPPVFLWVRVGNAANRVLIGRLDAQWLRIEAEIQEGRQVVELE